MDDKLFMFVSARVAEDQDRAKRLALDWIDGRTTWVDEGARVVGDIRRGFLEIAENLGLRNDAELSSLGEHMLKLLGYLYFDHPDYRPEWRPEP